MAKFTTRVELYGKPTWDDFDNLHEAMRKEAFPERFLFRATTPCGNCRMPNTTATRI